MEIIIIAIMKNFVQLKQLLNIWGHICIMPTPDSKTFPYSQKYTN